MIDVGGQELLTVVECAARFRVSEGMIRYLAKTRQIGHIRIGSKTVIPSSAVEEWMRTSLRTAESREANARRVAELKAYAREQARIPGAPDENVLLRNVVRGCYVGLLRGLNHREQEMVKRRRAREGVATAIKLARRLIRKKTPR